MSNDDFKAGFEENLNNGNWMHYNDLDRNVFEFCKNRSKPKQISLFGYLVIDLTDCSIVPNVMIDNLSIFLIV